MSPRYAARLLFAYLWTFLPMYGIERLANFYYLTHDPTFFLISGWRLEVFILSCLLGSVAAGALLRNLRLAIVSQGLALGTVLTLVYVGCDPRVCYSTGPDGFEPLRLGFFLGSVIISASSLGTSSQGAGPGERWEATMVGGAAFASVAWYPIIFTFAGTSLLDPFSPWGVLALLFALGLATAYGARQNSAWEIALLVPVGSLLLTYAVSAGIGWVYFESLSALLGFMTASTIIGALAGLLLARNLKDSARPSRPLSTAGFGVSIVLVLLMTVVVIPDAVSGVVPQGTHDNETFVMGSPVYAGAYMNAPQGHSQGAGVNLSFQGTDANGIQKDNYLAAGIAVHSANCCVDGIDFAYRFDLYSFRGGNGTILATAWEVCDDVVACGGHSWKVLMYSKSAPIDPALSVALRVLWSDGIVNWTYAARGGFVKFATFMPPRDENHAFNTGVSTGISLSSQSEAYFYQFGIMSKYPIEQPRWHVLFQCPSTMVNGTWHCIDHANTVTGKDSYWKVIWRWGEEYPGVSVSVVGKNAAQFTYNPPNATPDLTPLW